MNNELKKRIAAIYELINRGTDGEKQAAKLALDRIVKRHGLTHADVDGALISPLLVTYTTNLERVVFLHIVKKMAPGNKVYLVKRNHEGPCKRISVTLNDLERVTVECAYEYFRRHIKAQFKKATAAELARCRKAKTKAKKRAELEHYFLSSYIIKSGLCNPYDIKELDNVSAEERRARHMIDMSVEGGQYNKQIITNKLLD